MVAFFIWLRFFHYYTQIFLNLVYKQKKLLDLFCKISRELAISNSLPRTDNLNWKKKKISFYHWQKQTGKLRIARSAKNEFGKSTGNSDRNEWMLGCKLRIYIIQSYFLKSVNCTDIRNITAEVNVTMVKSPRKIMGS